MNRVVRQHSRHLAVSVFLVALGVAATSHGSPSQRQTQRAGHVTTYVCYGGLGDFEVLVHEDRISSLYWDSAIVSAEGPVHESFELRKQSTKKRVTMFPLAGAKPTDTVNYRVITEHCEASVTVKITRDADEALRIARVIVRPESEREADERRREQERRRKIERSVPMAELSSSVIVPDPDQVITTGDPVFVDVAHGWWEQDELFLAFDTLNKDVPSRQVAGVRAFNRAGEPLSIDVSHIQGHIPAVGQGSGQDDRTEETPLAIIPGGSKARGFISLPGVASGDIRGLTIVLFDDNGETLATASVGDWDSRRQILVPMSDEEIERQKRDEEARGRISLQLRAFRGFIWLSESPGSTVLDATRLQGLGIRATYGFNRHVTLDAEVSGATSGQARFPGSSFGGMDGELQRSTSLGGLYFGGQISVGYRIMPYVRFGVVLQGASHDSTFTPDGGSAVTGPDAPFEFATRLRVGGGVELRVGEHLVVALGALGVSSLASDDQLVSRALELNLHLGYGWKPR